MSVSMSIPGPLDRYKSVPLCQFDAQGKIFEPCCDPDERCCEDDDCRGIKRDTGGTPYRVMHDYLKPECIDDVTVQCVPMGRENSRCSYPQCKQLDEKGGNESPIESRAELKGKWVLSGSSAYTIPASDYKVSVTGEAEIVFGEFALDLKIRDMDIRVEDSSGETTEIEVPDTTEKGTLYRKVGDEILIPEAIVIGGSHLDLLVIKYDELCLRFQVVLEEVAYDVCMKLERGQGRGRRRRERQGRKKKTEKDRLSSGAIAGIVVGSLLLLLLIISVPIIAKKNRAQRLETHRFLD